MATNRKELELKEIIPTYYKNKAKADELKEILSKDNTKIKELCKSLKTDEFEMEGYKAKIVTSEKVDINMERLLFVLNSCSEVDTSNLIKTKQYVDMEELENMLYNNKFPKNVVKLIAECKDVKEIKSLRVTKSKTSH